VRLERLDLAPYGRFADRSLALSPQASLHVVFGRNESGKTTTLSAIGDLLFGFPKDTAYGFEHDQRLLRIGGALRLADGTRLDLRRRKGNKDTLLDLADRPVSEEPLRRALGAIDRKAFENEFGLTTQGLRAGGQRLLEAGGALAETLAAGSASLSALNELRKRLSEEAEGLFGARRSKEKPFYVALDRHADATARLRDAVVTADALKEADEAVLEAQARLTDLKARHEEAGRSVSRRRRALRVRDKLARLDAVAAELTALADLPQIAALAEARRALEDDRARQSDLARLSAEDARDAAERAALGLDPALLAQGAAIDGLSHDIGAVRKAEEDLPRRQEALEQTLARLDEIARRLGLDGASAVVAAAPSDAALARAKALIDKRARVGERRTEALGRRRAALEARERLGAAATSEAADPAPLKRRLDGFADALAEAERLTRERAQAEREARALGEEAAALDPAVADLDALARLALPDEEALQAHARGEAAAEDALRAAAQVLAAARRAAEASEADLRKREGGAAAATRADWDAARARREDALDRLEAALAGPVEVSGERLATARALTSAADAAVESVLADTARAARLQAAREDLTAKRAELTRAETDHAAALAARDEARAQACDLWAASGVVPRDSAAMASWRKRVAALLARRAALEKTRADLAALGERVEAARGALLGWLAEAGATAPAGPSFAEAHRAARARLDALQADWLAARERKLAAEQAEKTIAEEDAALASAEAAAAEIAAEWPSAMRDLRLRAEATPEEARAALAAWGDLAVPREKFAELTHRIETMRADIAEFERAVAAVAAAAAPALAGSRGRDALPKLAAALSAARRAADDEARLSRNAAQRALARQRLDAEREALSPTLARLREALGAADDEALGLALDRLDRRRALEAERDALRRDLAAAGDALDEAQLRAEQAELDPSTLQAQIDQAEQERATLLNEIGLAAAQASEAQGKREALARGRDAADAARERVEAAGELLDLAERWLARAAAAKLAHRAIEKHRAAAQDPLIARAGEMFALATAGSFADLAVGYDDADRPILVARRPGGQSVEVKGLSEGARDQLFLSLRLALLERRAGEPLPFIGDDLLASFDDARTAQALTLLAEFGQRGQAILFTHHARVAELASGLNRAAVEVIEMDAG
jgi:uncharacterized protein YhaN